MLQDDERSGILCQGGWHRGWPTGLFTLFGANVLGIHCRNFCRRLPICNPSLYAGEIAGFQGRGVAGSDRVEIDICHARGDGGFVEQWLGFEATFPDLQSLDERWLPPMGRPLDRSRVRVRKLLGDTYAGVITGNQATVYEFFEAWYTTDRRHC